MTAQGSTVHESVVVIDFGGQYNQLIARRIRECSVYSELLPPSVSVEELSQKNLKGIVFSGGPNSVFAPNAPNIDPRVYELGVPILGICYGMQLIAKQFAAKVERDHIREYGRANLLVEEDACQLFASLPREQGVWMSHSDVVREVPAGFRVDAVTPSGTIAAMSRADRQLYAVQFHPEVRHTDEGMALLSNFLFKICGCRGDWTMDSLIDGAIAQIREQVGGAKVLCALSGGVDSSVAAALVHRAIGSQLTAVFVDHGLLRAGESEAVMNTLGGQLGIDVIRVDASERFLGKLQDVRDPERKRKIIGEEFIRVFEAESERLGPFDFLVQGTLYTDVIESGTATAATIKSHHNVGGLPEDMKFQVIEPLRELFKDEVRALGEALGLPSSLVWRQPFPGPGLAIRIIGAVTPERLAIVRDSDAILREEIAKAGLERAVWQYFTVLTGVQSVGVMGDERTYAHTIAIRAVVSQEGMTADWARLPYEVLERISTRIVNEVRSVNRVVYDITSKPPATIEWE
ncbi:glutamine-hydrolyzing GMP synthase [Alicyclobacillus cycloheptanicus]|uniref:GMP synthase [glutamine-hydrolyzing] n=1 Tax=Alicyclobacillus cycloheptanicus TaxID=1457 RepID=A0ABT9XLI0_9BACL|nr:glutamine-hydrolyzing GMP synthase [Alicyclobacillus cycloheptanicus]MDQ0191168.1 GMP synthase (glutamine-hydrolyzing) [Alicyclobacillus cycloheptanicus]WDM02016.1 glutamine-hydrolyzing GMP synthase [Alicyclobacillus cycloheptanicus]